MKLFAALLILTSSSVTAFAPINTNHGSIATTTTTATTTATVPPSALNMASESASPFDFLNNLFKNDSAPAPEPIPAIPDVVITPAFSLAYVFAAIGISLEALNPFILGGVIPGGLHLALAALFGIQATRIRFLFDESSFSLQNVDNSNDNDDGLKSSGENVVVGGENRWGYDTFVNYDFFPNSEYPILVYFKETQTPEEKWNEGPGQLDKVGGGQVHFFPAIGNAKQLEEQFALRGCAKIED